MNNDSNNEVMQNNMTEQPIPTPEVQPESVGIDQNIVPEPVVETVPTQVVEADPVETTPIEVAPVEAVPAPVAEVPTEAASEVAPIPVAEAPVEVAPVAQEPVAETPVAVSTEVQANPEVPVNPAPVMNDQPVVENSQPPKKSSAKILIILVVLIIAGGVGFYFYNNSSNSNSGNEGNNENTANNNNEVDKDDKNDKDNKEDLMKDAKLLEDVTISGYSCMSNKCSLLLNEDQDANEYEYNSKDDDELLLKLDEYEDYIKVNLYYVEKEGKRTVVSYEIINKTDNTKLTDVKNESDLRDKIGLPLLGTHTDTFTLTEMDNDSPVFGFSDDDNYLIYSYVFTDSKQHSFQMEYKTEGKGLDLTVGNTYNVTFEVTDGSFGYEYIIKEVK